MKAALKNNILLIVKIILPSVLCTLLILSLKNYIEYQFVLIFGVAIILFNYGKIKYNFVLSLLLSIILSYIVFFLSFGIYLGTGYLIKGGDTEKIIDGLVMGIPVVRLHALISVSFISPLLMFYSYRFLFKIKKTNHIVYIKWISILVLFVFGLTKIAFENNYIFVSWQVIMALALQLVLYQKELKALFKPKKNG